MYYDNASLGTEKVLEPTLALSDARDGLVRWCATLKGGLYLEDSTGDGFSLNSILGQSDDLYDYWACLFLMMEYEPIEYTISFDGNGADEGEMESIEATYDEEYTLTANAFTREGYTFIGWNTEADGSGTSYEDGETVCNLTTTDGDTITLYAQWEQYLITVNSYTGDTLEADFDYEDGTTIIYIIDAVSFELEETYAWDWDATYEQTPDGLFFSEEAETELQNDYLFGDGKNFTSEYGYYDIYYTGSVLTTDGEELYLGNEFSKIGTRVLGYAVGGRLYTSREMWKKC